MNPTLALNRRYRALRGAGESYSWLTRTSFGSVFEELGRSSRLELGGPNSASAIAAAATALNDARDRFLTRLREVNDRRRLSKHAPRRPHEPPYESELLALVELGVPRATPPAAGAPASETVASDRLPRPAFAVGSLVRVVLNERNRTPRTGLVRRLTWHHKLRCWTYLLAVDGRSLSKRHLESDLRRDDAG